MLHSSNVLLRHSENETLTTVINYKLYNNVKKTQLFHFSYSVTHLSEKASANSQYRLTDVLNLSSMKVRHFQ